MSQMAGVGARHFYSIVVIDFIMSDVYEARPRTKPGEKARGRLRPGGPDTRQTRSQPPRTEAWRLGGRYAVLALFRALSLSSSHGSQAGGPRPFGGEAGVKRICSEPAEPPMREANQGNGWDPCRE
jgi:hypothetical protein